MSQGLIVDVGMHDATDTAHYLSRGFDVLAVEANPRFVELARKRFGSEIAAGRLTIVNEAVAPTEGIVEFFVGDDDLWSSTDAAWAASGVQGDTLQRIMVACRPLASMLAGRPTPYYVKIDVEGQDADCVRSLGDLRKPPTFVSFEVNLGDVALTVELIELLRGRGYRRFKLVNQATPPPGFTKHSSGPFGEDTVGPWLGADELIARFKVVMANQSMRNEYSKTGRVLGVPIGKFHRQLTWFYNCAPVADLRRRWAKLRGLEVGGWFDVHAGL